MQSADITISRERALTLITAPDVLDRSNSKKLDRAIANAVVVASGIVLDLRHCRSCDSDALAMVAKRKYLLKDQLQIVLGSTGAVRRVFEVTGLSRRSDLHASVEAARTRFTS